jgi:transcriptional regulator with XRE-family HTH domain
MIDKENFGKRISDCMEKSGKSNKEITAQLGLSKNMIGNCKKNQIPSTETLFELSQILGTTVEYLLTGKQSESLSVQEKKLIESYRSCSPERQAIIRELLNVPEETEESSLSKIG